MVEEQGALAPPALKVRVKFLACRMLNFQAVLKAAAQTDANTGNPDVQYTNCQCNHRRKEIETIGIYTSLQRIQIYPSRRTCRISTEA